MILQIRGVKCIDTSRFIDSVSVNEHSVCARRRVFPTGNDQVHSASSFSYFLFFAFYLHLLSCCRTCSVPLVGTMRARNKIPVLVFSGVFPAGLSKKNTHRFSDGHQGSLLQMGVSHGGSGIAMPQKFLHFIERVPGIDQK